MSCGRDWANCSSPSPKCRCRASAACWCSPGGRSSSAKGTMGTGLVMRETLRSGVMLRQPRCRSIRRCSRTGSPAPWGCAREYRISGGLAGAYEGGPRFLRHRCSWRCLQHQGWSFSRWLHRWQYQQRQLLLYSDRNKALKRSFPSHSVSDRQSLFFSYRKVPAYVAMDQSIDSFMSFSRWSC